MVKLTSGGQCWAFSSSQHVNSAVNDVEEYLSTQDKWIMPAKADTHLPTPYRSELDITPVLKAEQSSYLCP